MAKGEVVLWQKDKLVIWSPDQRWTAEKLSFPHFAHISCCCCCSCSITLTLLHWVALELHWITLYSLHSQATQIQIQKIQIQFEKVANTIALYCIGFPGPQSTNRAEQGGRAAHHALLTYHHHHHALLTYKKLFTRVTFIITAHHALSKLKKKLLWESSLSW